MRLSTGALTGFLGFGVSGFRMLALKKVLLGLEGFLTVVVGFYFFGELWWFFRQLLGLGLFLQRCRVGFGMALAGF